MPYFDAEALREWFESEKRDLPWRREPTPYAVWVSEIMLQQTQASVVAPYFERWMSRFPSIKALACAPIEDVVKLWEGLGYYSRARNLHAAAKDLMSNHGGELPSRGDALHKIKGIGPYTRGAILSFAFHQKAAAVDGNVLRVLSRYFAIEEQLEKVQKEIQKLTEEILPDKEPWVVMEALIELGAKVCKKNPVCSECPVKRSCLAHQQNRTHLLPNKRPRRAATHLKRAVALIAHEDAFLVGCVPEKKVMAGLYEFPYVEFEGEKPILALRKLLSREFDLSAEFIKNLPEEKHSFTRYHATLYPSLWKAERRVPVHNFKWMQKGELSSLPFSSGHLRILKNAHITH